MTEPQDDLLQRGIAAAKAGQVDEARRLLAQALKLNPRSEAAWLWMSGVVQTREERIRCLKQVIAINPRNTLALRGLRALGVPAEAAPARQVEAPDGVPLVPEDAIAQARREAEAVLRAIQEETESGTLDINWAQPETLRARPGFSVSPMVFAIGGSFLIVVLVIILASLLLGIMRQRRPAVASVPSSEVASSPTPTVYVTPRPTRTPTPEGQPITPEPVLPVGDAPRGDLRYGLTPTPPYIATPHPSSPRMNDAIQAFHEGRYDQVIELIGRARQAGYDSVDSYYFEGMSLAYLGDLDAAEDVLKAGLEMDETFAPLHAALGYVYTRQGATERARLENERAKQLDPALVIAYLNLAETYLAEGDVQAALAEVEAIREQRPYDVNALVMAGKVYLANGQPEQAVAVGNLAHYIDPGSEDVILLLARARLAMGLTRSAIMGLEEYVDRVYPVDAEAWVLLGQAYEREGRFDDALEAYQIALQIQGDSVDALIGRGLFYFERGDYEQAYADLDAALSLESEHPRARYGRALSAFALGNYEQALEDLEFVREQTGDLGDVDLLEVETLYVRALVENEAYAKVIEEATAALALGLTPAQQGYVFEARARAYYETGEYEDALRDIVQALTLEETGTRHYYHGLILEALGNITAAMREYEWVVFWDQTFDYPFGDDAQERLEALSEIEGLELTPSPTPGPTRTPSPRGTPTVTATP